MSKYKLIIILGFFVALMPFLGFPGSWKTVLLVIVGFTIAVLALLLRRETLDSKQKTDVYVENTDYAETKKIS